MQNETDNSTARDSNPEFEIEKIKLDHQLKALKIKGFYFTISALFFAIAVISHGYFSTQNINLGSSKAKLDLAANTSNSMVERKNEKQRNATADRKSEEALSSAYVFIDAQQAQEKTHPLPIEPLIKFIESQFAAGIINKSQFSDLKSGLISIGKEASVDLIKSLFKKILGEPEEKPGKDHKTEREGNLEINISNNVTQNNNPLQQRPTITKKDAPHKNQCTR